MQKSNPCLNFFKDVPLEYSSQEKPRSIICSQNKQQIAIFRKDNVIVYLLKNEKWIEHFQHKLNLDTSKLLCFNLNQQNQILFYEYKQESILCLNFNTTITQGCDEHVIVNIEQFIKLPSDKGMDYPSQMKVLDDDKFILIVFKNSMIVVDVIQQTITHVLPKIYYGFFQTQLYDNNRVNSLIDPFYINYRDIKESNFDEGQWTFNNCLLLQNINNLKGGKILFFHNYIDRNFVLQISKIDKLDDCGNIAVVRQYTECQSGFIKQHYEWLQKSESERQFCQLTLCNLINLKIMRKIKYKKDLAFLSYHFSQLKGRYYYSDSYIIDTITLKEEQIIKKKGWRAEVQKNILTLKNEQECQYWIFK